VKTLARAEDLAEVRTRLGLLEPGLAPRWGRMTVHQMVCHAADACRLALGERPSTRRPGRAVGVKKLVALWLPLPWPRGIGTTEEIDQCGGGGTRPTAFEADRVTLLSLVDRVAAAADLERHGHPVFGPMSRAAWLRWAYLHLDHHLRQFGR
jgi:hypothetical protein